MTAAADLAIRLRRAAFNRAIADADLSGIGPILARNVVMVTGSDSAVLSGQKAQLQAWKHEFAARPRTIYTRTPATIEAGTVEPVAMEIGQWQGVSAEGGPPLASGSYCAKWRRTGADWVIEAEVFVTLA